MTIEETKEPKRYIIYVDDSKVECRKILEELIKRNLDKISPIDSMYYSNAFEYLFRLFEKHDNPETDIRKAIQELIFLLEAKTGKVTELVDKKPQAVTAREQLMKDFVGVSNIDKVI